MNVKVLFNIIGLMIALLGLLIFIELKRYMKKHGNKEVMEIEGGLKIRFIVLHICSIIAPILILIGNIFG